jgi:ABC-2 type transport system permease protein
VNRFFWLIRRELWENKAIWTMPAALGAFLILAALFGQVHLDLSTFDLHMLQRTGQDVGRSMNGTILLVISALFFLVMSIYSSWYFLECLYADRKDRSVLFWKSLPVSDTATVLSKLGMGLVVIPLVYFVFADATSALVAFVLSVRSSSLFAGGLWHADVWLQLQALWLYVIATVAIWFLPVAGWFMLISAWARRAAMLWCILPPLALVLGERALFGSHELADLITARLTDGYFKTAFALGPMIDVWSWLNPVHFFSSPATWIGAAVAIALLAATIQVRWRRTEV